MSTSPINYKIVQLSESEMQARLPELVEILVNVVEGGASVNFMPPFTPTESLDYWQKIVPVVKEGRVILLVALVEGKAVGTVQLVLPIPPNQSHRADVAKLLVHQSARRYGIARALMQHLETVARRHGRTLLTLDTMTGTVAERLYLSLGYILVGIIPGYSYFPNGSLGDTAFFYKPL